MVQFEKTQALRLRISERKKYLETTFEHIGPIQEMMQTVTKIIPTTESDQYLTTRILPVTMFEKTRRQ